MQNDYAEAVLELACLVARGSVVSYGDVAELLGAGGPRQVGSAMSRGAEHGPGPVPWWRVVRADGTLPQGLAVEAEARWAEEGTPRRGGRVAMGEARWRPSESDFEAIDTLAGRLRAPEPKCRDPLI
ncbi:MGMT family protein [Arthrobacter sp. KK5.5]|uniref:MGMT family protein n=1 Tax=Arthrobacter sp. KK5.5 TaxID=3373084 RepID=UPI003EE68AA5